MSDLQTILLECEYFPCIEWYRNFISNETILLEQYEYFERASLRNRCYVAGSTGRLALSVPLDGGRNQRVVMKNLKISYRERWQIQHWRTLLACYNRSPFFEFYEPAMKKFFDTRYIFLLELNLASIQLINDLLGIKKTISLTNEYIKHPPVNTSDLRKKLNAENYDQDNNISYLQPFEDKNGFIAGLSMLDMLFCTGKQATTLLLR